MMKAALCIILFTIFSLSSKAQLAAEADGNGAALTKALSYYIESIGINAAIYSGSENPDPRYPVNDGSPFYGGEVAVKGDILYDDILYKAVPMWLDLVRNEVAVQHPRRNARVALNSQRVKYFTLGTALFIPASPEMIAQGFAEADFFRVLHDRETALLGKYSRKMFEVIRESQYVTNYSKQESEYFLLNKGTYYPVKNTSDIINVLDDKKQELQQRLKVIQQEMKKDNIRFSKSSELAMVGILDYYDQLKP